VIEEVNRFDNAIALLPPSTHASDLRRFWRERFNRVTWSIQTLCQNRSNRLRGVIGNRMSGSTVSRPDRHAILIIPNVDALKLFDKQTVNSLKNGLEGRVKKLSKRSHDEGV